MCNPFACANLVALDTNINSRAGVPSASAWNAFAICNESLVRLKIPYPSSFNSPSKSTLGLTLCLG